MGWSTRELAALGGTSLRAVRHYHEQGLLQEPERLSNGYKVYRTEHLVRLLQIRRLGAIGLSLKQIASIDEGPTQEHEAALAAADDELREAIARLEHARSELADFRRLLVPADMPARLSATASAARLSRPDRALYAVLAQLYGDDSADYWMGLMENSVRDPTTEEFDQLPEDASEATLDRIASHFVEQIRAASIELPDAAFPAPQTDPTKERAVVDVLIDLYSPAQLSVLERMGKLMGYL